MSNVAKFNEKTATELGLPAAIMLKKLVQSTCNLAAQLEGEDGYQEGPLGINSSKPGTEEFPYLRPDQIEEGMRQLVAAGIVQTELIGDRDDNRYRITEKALEAEDRDGELEWKVYYKSVPFKPSGIQPPCLL